jgi:hypothetical protein
MLAVCAAEVPLTAAHGCLRPLPAVSAAPGPALPAEPAELRWCCLAAARSCVPVLKLPTGPAEAWPQAS